MALYTSGEVEAEWKKQGSPYCEHPKFLRDHGPYGKDHTDHYCTTCGAIWINKWPDDRPEPRGDR